MEENPTHPPAPSVIPEAAPAQPPPMPPSHGQAPPPLMQMQMVPGMPHYGGMIPVVTEDDKNMAALCHFLSIVTGFLGPLIIWLVKKDTSPFLDHHGREALNFQITMLLITIGLFAVTIVLMLLLVGILLMPLLFVLPLVIIVLEVLAGVAASRGEWHRYPFSIRFL